MNQRWFSSERARRSFRAGAVRPKRQTSVQHAEALRGQYAQILANFRSRRLRKFGPVGHSAQPVLSLDILKSPVVAPDRKSLSGLDANVLSELTDEDPSVRLMKRVLINRDYEGICRNDAYLKSFWQCSAVVDGCVVVDNRIAIPSCLQKPILARLHQLHEGQLAIVHAAQ